MTTAERLNKALQDYVGIRERVEQQIVADKLQLEANQSTLVQIDTVIASVRFALASEENTTTVALSLSPAV